MVMSINLKTSFKALALGTMLSLAPVANDAMAQDTHDSDPRVNTTAPAPFKHSIKKRDSRKSDPQAATIAASILSAKKNAMVLIYSGSNESHIEKVHKSGSLARNNKKRVLGIAVVSNYDAIGDDKFVIAYNGQTTLPRDPALLSGQDIQDFIAETQSDLLVPSVLKERTLARAKEQIIAANVPIHLKL